MTLLNPAALLFLCVLPLVAYIGWPRNRFRRLRDSASLLLRMLILLLAVLALADIQHVRSADDLSVIFLLDVSDSMDSASLEAAEQFIRTALPNKHPDDLSGVVAFGTDAQVARSLSNAQELGPVRAMPQTGHTNLAAAIRMGLAMFPGDTARRMVILSDGQPTMGDTMGAAQLADAANVEVSYVRYTRAPAPEIQVRDVIVPSVLNENQDFNLIVNIVSQQDTTATITVQASGEIVSRQERALHAGENTYTLRLRSGAAGFRDFLVQVDPPESSPGAYQDGFYQNNKLSAFSRVEGAPRILLVAATPEDSRYIVPALRESGLDLDAITPGSFPTSITGLADYDAIVLVNVSAQSLSMRSMVSLQRYVRDLGGGLVAIGGPQAYGPGGYFQTPLEEILPVEVRLKDQERMPQLTIAYVIDRSGSMGIAQRDGSPSNLELAKEAINRSVEFLQPVDRVGIATFDVNAYWIAEFQDVSSRYEFQRLVATLRPGGGTSIMAGMTLVSRDIVREESPLKHVILLTDGQADSSGLVSMARDLYTLYGVTISTISLNPRGGGFLEDMAREGGGYYHNITDPASIPAIFAQETVLATRAYVQEATFIPTLTAIHPIMQYLNSLPQLFGYVATEPRPAAQVILRGPDPYNDPILAAWQYGLGRSVAFTSDATALWAQQWVSWESFAAFWSQAVRWTITEGAASNLETRIQLDGRQAQIVVDARDNDGQFLNGLDLQASVVFSGSQDSQRVRLRQVAPGHYEGAFIPTEEGAYLLRVSHIPDDTEEDDLSEADGLNLTQMTGWVMSYSQEYDIRETDETLLDSIAGMTGGRDLSLLPDAVFARNLKAQESLVPLWPWLVLVALLLLPVDVGVRRLLVTQSDLRRVREWLFGRDVVASTPSERLESLKRARDRVRQQMRPQTPSAAPLEGEHLEQHTTRPSPGQAQQPPDNLGARLLKKRRRDEDPDSV